MLFVELGVASVLVVVAGSLLVRFGDRLAERTGLGGAWIGFALLAAITSLPEVVTSLSAVTVLGQPDLVFGNLFGANLFNLLQVAVLSVLVGRESILVRVGPRAMLSAAFGVVVMSVAALALAAAPSGGGPPGAGRFLWIASPLLFLTYLLVMRVIFRDEREAMMEAAQAKGEAPATRQGVRREATGLLVCAAVIIGSGLWLSSAADRLAVRPFRIGGATQVLGRSFVGVLVLALVTTLPEVTVSIACLRIKAYAMALGNLLGSNIFNMAIVALADGANWVARGRTIFRGADPGTRPLNPVHLVTAVAAIAMTGVMMAGLAGRRRRRIIPIGWEEAAMLLLWAAAFFLVYRGSVQAPGG